MTLIAPAILAGDCARLGETLETIKAAGASLVHVDVMDGHYMPEITVGQPVLRSLRKATDLTLDVHLLIERPERYVAEFLDAGADRLAVHPEAAVHLHRVLDFIRARGATAGVALDPATPIETVAEVLGELDFLTILSAELGVSPEVFISRTVARVRAASRMREEGGLEFALQVEGAVNFDHLEELVRAGADILVVGSAIFHSEDPQTRLSEIIRRAGEARQTSKV